MKFFIIICVLAALLVGCKTSNNVKLLKKIDKEKKHFYKFHNLKRLNVFDEIASILESSKINLSKQDTIYFFEGYFSENASIIGRLWSKEFDLRYNFENEFNFFIKTKDNINDNNILNHVFDSSFSNLSLLIENGNFELIRNISNKSFVHGGGIYIATIIYRKGEAVNSIYFNELSNHLF
ncbi:MAG: hypothetical protein PHT69_05300 [Bacteroidales bacterium]|nr:hypothetical protein [Bacteroidales bacterium]